MVQPSVQIGIRVPLDQRDFLNVYVEKAMNQSFIDFYIALTIAARARLLFKISIKTNALACVNR
jgi:hypothetical protein